MALNQNRLENLANLRIANADGAFATAFASLSAGAILIGFVKFLGGSDIWIGALAALSGSPSVFGLLQIPGAVLGRRSASYKRFVTPWGNIWRLLYLPLVALPLAPIDNQLKLSILIVCVSVATAATLFVNSTYNEWLAELVPPSSRGWFYSRRTAITTLFGAVAALIGGVIVDEFKARGQEALGFTAVFALGSAFSFVSLFFYYRMAETPRPVVVRQNLGEALKDLSKPLVDRNYLSVLIFLSGVTFAQQFAGNFFTAFALESLGLPFTILTLAGVTQALGTVAASPLFGFLSDKYGNKPILFLGALCTVVTPVMWLLCYPGQTAHNAAVLLPISMFVGVVWAAVNLTQFNIVLATSPPADRAGYLGVALTAQNVMGFIAPLAGAAAMSYLRAHSADATQAYKLLFGVTMALRFVAVFALAPVDEPGAFRIRTTLRHISRITPRGVRAMRTLTQSGDVTTREQAIRSVVQSNLSMAGDELIKALHDPSPRIRRQAAAGLARLRDPNAAEALLHQLVDHPDLVEEETIDALGQLAGRDAIGPVTRLLKDPRSVIRRAAVRALGRIGDLSALPALAEAARTGDPDMKRASLQALRTLCADCEPDVFSEALLDPAPSVRIAASEGVAELQLCSAAENARKSIELFQDEATSEVSYALGAIGSDEDIPLILQVAKQCVSMITRRRCLLAIARILGVEKPCYRLLLLEGMSRDAALLDMTRPLVRRSKKISEGVEMYSSGDEAGALATVANSLKQPILRYMAREPVEELFVVVICYLAAQGRKKITLRSLSQSLAPALRFR